jgi:cell volume regulation protein A
VTRDVLLTLSLMLSAALAARFLASLARIPEILLLVLFGALLGPSMLDVIDVPLDSLGAQLIFTLGVSMILFYGGLNLSFRVLRQVWVEARAAHPGGDPDGGSHRRGPAHLAFGLSLDRGAAHGSSAIAHRSRHPDTAVRRSRLRPKVAETVVAESAFNDPTGAVLAPALASVLVSGDSSVGTPVADFLANLAISTVIGIVAGVLLSATVSSRRGGIWRESSERLPSWSSRSATSRSTPPVAAATWVRFSPG